MQATTGVSISGSLHGLLHGIVPEMHPVEILPFRFIVAWHGVLTLAFNAWPQQLAEIKKRINDMPEFSASPENFGTRWPKLTLAALNADAPPLTLDQLRKLTALCQEFEASLQRLGSVTLSNCSLVMFASRSLEHCLCRVDYPFVNEKLLPPTHPKNMAQEYDAASYEIVRDVVRETEEQLDEYINKVNAPGHRWGGHYNTTWTETTLVCFLTNGNGNADNIISPSTSNLLDIVASFRERVDALLPGAYTWMPQKTLHLSLRALDNRSNVERNVQGMK